MELEKTCCFTGHRQIDESRLPLIKKRLRLAITNLIKEGYQHFCSGGALGFDMLAAEIVLSLKKKYPHIRLIMVLPCKNQSRFWPEEEKTRQKNIITAADMTIYTAERYYTGCMHKRNRYMVDASSCVLAYLTEESSPKGFWQTYKELAQSGILSKKKQDAIKENDNALPLSSALENEGDLETENSHKRAGGTKYTVEYARKKGVPTVFISDVPSLQLSLLY